MIVWDVSSVSSLFGKCWIKLWSSRALSRGRRDEMSHIWFNFINWIVFLVVNIFDLFFITLIYYDFTIMIYERLNRWFANRQYYLPYEDLCLTASILTFAWLILFSLRRFVVFACRNFVVFFLFKSNWSFSSLFIFYLRFWFDFNKVLSFYSLYSS